MAWAWRGWGGWEDFIEWGHMVFKRMGGGISRRQHSTNGSYKKTDCQLNSNEDGIVSKILLRRKQNPPLLLPPPKKNTTTIYQNKTKQTRRYITNRLWMDKNCKILTIICETLINPKWLSRYSFVGQNQGSFISFPQSGLAPV